MMPQEQGQRRAGSALPEGLRDSLIKGHYNLLVGAGISLDSRTATGEPLPSSDRLRTDLCKVTGAPSNASLNRVATLLNEAQTLEHLTRRFTGCRPANSLFGLPNYLWRRIFTFNIDDVLETLYAESPSAKQRLVPLNFDAPFEPTPDRAELQVIHLHGWVRKPGPGYVFSVAEYTQRMHASNPWMRLLAEILATEPFIIAGTSLDEIDLEYYLSFRSAQTPRRDRGPSVLVEPNPTVLTESECRRHGLHLFRGTFEDFLRALAHEIPAPPTVYELVVPDAGNLFTTPPSSTDALAFFSDFDLVQAARLPLPVTPTAFLYGREPTWNDIAFHLDIEREDNTILHAKIKAALDKAGEESAKIVILDDAGTGKTTVARRVVHDLIEQGVPVLSVSTTSRLNPDVSIRCLRALKTHVILLVDGIADHAEQVAQILQDSQARSKVVLLGTERGYRKDYLALAFGSSKLSYHRLRKPASGEIRQLIERYRKYGLIGTAGALHKPDEFAPQLTGDPMAVAICRIMNDFKPLQQIVRSLWDAGGPHGRRLFMCVALAELCSRAGLRYSILQTIAGPRESIAPMFEVDAPLSLALNPTDDQHVTALNGVIADQILHYAIEHHRAVLQDAFTSVATALAPHVNRRAIMNRSPEARLAGRLFDCDKVVKPLLKEGAEQFYVTVQAAWEWNSRYWEQRALLVSQTDLDQAISFAKHAVAIEQHPYPLTTLGKLVLKRMESTPEKRDDAYAEAAASLNDAIDREHRFSRITIHPYMTLFAGTASYLELGGRLADSDRKRIGEHLEEAKFEFFGDVQLDAAIARLERLL